MNVIDSILVPLDGSTASARSLGCAAWIAQRVGATLHVLSAGSAELPVHENLRRLQVPEEYWSRIMLHVAPEFPEQAIIEAAGAYAVQLIVMTARGETAKAPDEEDDPLKVLGHVTQSVVQQSPVPVLVLPRSYRETLPLTTALVPISGEPEADAALTVAVRFSNALGLKATAVHVLCPREASAGLAAEAHYADAAHHEYPYRLQELVARGLPGCHPAESECIADVVVSRGDVATELLKLLEERHIDLLVIGWHGRFFAGHADVLKTLLARASCPVLLVKAAPPAAFKLRVGDELE